MEIVKLRCHHLICLSNFVGEGYDLKFIENMKRIHSRLKSDLELKCVQIVEGLDDLCFFCPNRFKKKLMKFLISNLKVVVLVRV